MGLFDGIGLGQVGGLGSGYASTGISDLLGVYPGYEQQAMSQEQQARMQATMGQQQSSPTPLEQAFMRMRSEGDMFPNYGEAYNRTRKVKHVESREVTPRERARKQIQGAVQAVKDAQDRV